MNEKSGFEILPIDVGDKRIDFGSLVKTKTALITNRLFKTYDFLWVLKIKESDFFLSKGKPHVQKISGTNWMVSIHLKSGQEEFVVIISIGTSVPDAIKDVILYHELRESFWRFVGKLSLKEAHEKAVTEEREYVKKYLSLIEKETLNKFVEEVKTWEPRPLSDKDLKSDEADGLETIK